MRVSALLGAACALLLAPMAAHAVVFDPTPITFGEHASALDAEDPTDDEDRYFERYSVTLEAGTPVLMTITSEIFDTFLEITAPDGTIVTNDDFGGSTDSGYELTPAEGGVYEIRVTSYASGETGDYQLSVLEIGPGHLGELVAFGEPYSGTLTEHGAGPAANMGASLWFEAQAGERMHFRVTSPDFDTVAQLVGPGGLTWYNDDANDVGPDGTESLLDSTIDALAAEAGLYHLTVTPYGGDAAGAFTVRPSNEPPVTRAEGAETPEMGFAGSEGDGRMYGVFVGIGDYMGEDSDLYACDNDAIFAAQAFRERGLMGVADQRVIVNDQATIAGVREAVTWLIGQTGPDDVAVFFYSGHGGVQPAAEDEVYDIDGTNETLYLYDGHLTDTVFTQDFEPMTADTTLLVLDACHSGGFARDFVSQPGRIGIFSSDEDVLSDTAEPYLSGGYVSYFFREAVLGHADGRPNDGLLLAGEFTDYLVEGFVQAHSHMNDPTDPDPYQRVVIRRGSVRWDDSLWIFPRLPNGELAPIPDVCMDTPLEDAPDGAGNTCTP